MTVNVQCVIYKCHIMNLKKLAEDRNSTSKLIQQWCKKKVSAIFSRGFTPVTFSHKYEAVTRLIIPAQSSCVSSTIISIRGKLAHRPILLPRSPRWSWHFTAKHFILWSVAISCKLLLGLLRSRSVSTALCNLAYNFTLVESLWSLLRAMITMIAGGGLWQ